MLSPARGLRTTLLLGVVLSVVSCDQTQVIAPIGTVASHSIATLPALTASFAYVTNQSSHNVSVVATATNSVVARVPFDDLSFPLGLAVTPDGRFAYVADGGNRVLVISTATNTVVAVITLGAVIGAGPWGVVITPDGAYAYVTNFQSSTVSVIGTATNSVVATVAVGLQPVGIALSPDGAFAYVTNTVSNTVSVISTMTNTVVGTVAVDIYPHSVAVTPDGAFAYVMTGSGISVISTATKTVAATIPLGFTGNSGVAITPDGAFAYVTNQVTNMALVIALATNALIATINVGASPWDLAITPDGNFVYVTNTNSNSVSVIATATNTVVATVGVGFDPRYVAITPATPGAGFTIDLQPEDPNNVLRLTGLRTEVAILSTNSFDASKIDPATCTLNGGAEGIRPILSLTRTLDFGRDGDLDLLLTFSTPALIKTSNLSATTTNMTLRCGTLADTDVVRPT